MNRTLILASLLCLPLSAQETAIELDPAQTEITWTLGDVLHTVHGTFKLTRGELKFDPTTGKAGGEFVVDVLSGQSGSNARDKRMHKEILESRKFPEAVFTPDRIEGTLTPAGDSKLSVHGVFNIHGTGHELTLTLQVHGKDGHYAATTHFVIPYVEWGMKNPSNFLLKVNQTVDVDVRTNGTSR